MIENRRNLRIWHSCRLPIPLHSHFLLLIQWKFLARFRGVILAPFTFLAHRAICLAIAGHSISVGPAIQKEAIPIPLLSLARANLQVS